MDFGDGTNLKNRLYPTVEIEVFLYFTSSTLIILAF